MSVSEAERNLVYQAFVDRLSEPVAEVRGDIAELRGELKADIGNLHRWGAGIMVANGVAVITALLS